MNEDVRYSDEKRFTQRLWRYLSGLEKITGIIGEKTGSEQFDIDKLLEKMLPFLNRVFNSEIAFTADDKRKIIKSFPEPSLEGNAIPELMKDEGILVSSNTSGHFPGLKELNINSIMVLKFKMQGQDRWIGVCNGKNEPEPYLGEDKKFFRIIISLMLNIGFKSGHSLGFRNGYESEEKNACEKRYKDALIGGNWAELARASAEYVKKFKDLAKLPDFLDTELCDTIHKSLLNQGTAKFEKVQIIDVNEEEEIFKVKIMKDKPLKINDNKRAALACLRILLFRIFSNQIPGKTGPTDESNKSDGATTSKYPEWKKIFEDKAINKTIESQEDFDLKVDLLRTQWLRIYYLARQGSFQPIINKPDEIQIIYGKIWRKTVSLLQDHLSCGSQVKNGEKKNEKPGKSVGINIDSDWLLTFLAQNVLLSRNLNEFYDLDPYIDKSSPQEKGSCNPLTGARFFHHLSRFILYILHYIRFAWKEAEYKAGEKDEYDNKIEKKEDSDRFVQPPFADVPYTPDTSLSESFIFMVSEYAYREIGVPRELLIFEKLRQQLNFELPLYAASEFYRDHSYHVIDVCLLGEFFLTCCLFEKNSGQGNKRSFFPKLENPYKADFLKNWYTAALCHDLGYVVERVEKLVGPIEKLKCEGLNQFNDNLKQGIGQGKEMLKKTIESLCADGDMEIADELKKIAAKRTDTLDHGIIGWLYLCQVLKQMEIPICTMKHALLAVLRHNLTEHEKNIHGEPLSLLLMLCDHLQEWGRPKVASEQFASGVMEILRFSRQESYLEKQVHLNRFSIKGMILKNLKREELPGDICDRCINNDLCKKEPNCLRLWPEIIDTTEGVEFQLSYHGDLRIEFEPVLSWLYFCHDFQCVDYSLRRFLFPISIRFTHTLSKQRRDIDDGIPELDIFEEFANTYKEGEAAYLCGWIENARQNKEGIDYRITDTGNGNGKLEEFIIHLDKLERPLARGLERNHGRDFLKWKRRWRARKHLSRNIGGWYPDIE